MGDEEGVDTSILCKAQEPLQAAPLHVQSRANVGEYQGSGLTVLSAMFGEEFELAVKVTISLLAMS